MLHIGCHLSCAKGYLSMGEQALALGADTFQFFTRNPRGGSVKPFDRQDADALNDFLAAHRFADSRACAVYAQRLRGGCVHPRICRAHHAGGFGAPCAYPQRDA